MPRCPQCNSIECDDVKYERDDDGVIVYWEYECENCGCQFYHEDVIGIIKEGDYEREDDEDGD